MKKLSKLLLCLTLILVSCFAMVGCGDTPPGTEIKIYFGTEDYNPAGGEYTTPIKLTDFVIE